MTLSMLAIGIVGAYSYFSARKAQMERTYDQLASVKYLKKKQVENFYTQQVRIAGSLAGSEGIQTIMHPENKLINHSPQVLIEAFRSLELINRHEKILYLSAGNCYSLSVGDKSTPILIKTDPPVGDSVLSLVKAEKTLVTDLMPCRDGKGWVQYVIVRVAGTELETDDFLALEISSETIDCLMPDQNPLNGLGNSGEAYLAGEDRYLRSSSRFLKDAIFTNRIDTSTLRLAIEGQEGTWLLRDYRGVPVLGAFAVLESPAPRWILIAEIDLKEAMVPIDTIRNNVLFISVFIAAFVLLVTWLIARRITRPVILLQKAAREVGDGKLGTTVDIQSNDEIGELASVFNHMSGQLSDKDQQINKERARRMKAAFDGQDIERQRLSRELHDGLGQSLIAQKLRLESLQTNKEGIDLRQLDNLKRCADQLVDEVRRISNALMPAQLIQFGLAAALRQHCEEVAGYSKVEIKFDATGNFEHLSKKTKTYLFRIVQEALNNVVKHSEATIVSVELATTREHLFLSIADNGCGFDKSSICKGNGLNNMKERTELLNGSLVMNSMTGKGTTIEIQIPFKS
jgi:signal transduction histidine kinase